MRIGIIGSGDVAKALGKGFTARGHDVLLGTRDPESGVLDSWREATSGRVGTMAAAAAHGDVIVLAVLGDAVEHAIDLAGRERFTGKLVIDATNPLDFSGDGAPGLTHALDDSNGERVQRKLPDARVVKAFNSVPNPRMMDPGFEGARMLVCGNDADAKKRVEALVQECGWAGVIDLGDIVESRWLEALVPLWARVGLALERWDHVFLVRP